MRGLPQQTYDRTKQLTTRDFASVQKLDEATATLDVARRSQQQAKLALDEAIAGYTDEERGVAQAAVVKAEAAIATLQGPGRRIDGQGAERGAGLPHERRGRRVRVARRAAAVAGRPVAMSGCASTCARTW